MSQRAELRRAVELAKRFCADVFEKRKTIVLAVYKQDAAERRIVALKLKTDELDGVRSLAEHVARSPSAMPARECVAQGCASTWRALCRLCRRVAFVLCRWTRFRLGRTMKGLRSCTKGCSFMLTLPGGILTLGGYWAWQFHELEACMD